MEKNVGGKGERGREIKGEVIEKGGQKGRERMK